jgi:putative hemolysin
MELSLLLALILINGFFAMSEIALVTARKARLRAQADAGDRRAARALRLGEHPTRFLSTIQIGITSIGVLNGIVGEATFAGPLELWLQRLGAPPEASELGATGLVVVVVTYATIVLGELVPKRLGQLNPERLARAVALPMDLLATLVRPFVVLLSASTELVLRLLRARATSAEAVTEEEIHALLEEGSEAGVIDEQERTMVRNVFRLEDRPVTTLMTPRTDIVYLDLESPAAENLAAIRESAHSRFPVGRGGLGEVVGLASAKQLLTQAIRGEPLDLTQNLEPVVFVPDSISGMELLETFRSSKVQLVMVVDEYGQVRGLATLQDLLVAIAGEFGEEDARSRAFRRADGSWLLDGALPVPDVMDHLGLRVRPDDGGDYETLSGLVMYRLDRMPRTGDRVHWAGWTLEIVDMDGRRIDKIMATREAPAPDG